MTPRKGEVRRFRCDSATASLPETVRYRAYDGQIVTVVGLLNNLGADAMYEVCFADGWHAAVFLHEITEVV